MVNKTSMAVEKWSVPLYWDNDKVTTDQIDFRKVACVPKKEIASILGKYKKMEEALDKITPEQFESLAAFIDRNDKDIGHEDDEVQRDLRSFAKNQREALSFDPLSNEKPS